jgi:hypothetical protein
MSLMLSFMFEIFNEISSPIIYLDSRNRNVFPATPRRRRGQPGQGRRVQLGRVDQGEIVTESSSSTSRSP